MSRKVSRRVRDLAREIARLLDEGERPVQIALALGVSPSCVRRTARRFGLALPTAGARRVGCMIPERCILVIRDAASAAGVPVSVLAQRIIVSLAGDGPERLRRELGKAALPKRGAKRRGADEP